MAGDYFANSGRSAKNRLAFGHTLSLPDKSRAKTLSRKEFGREAREMTGMRRGLWRWRRKDGSMATLLPPGDCVACRLLPEASAESRMRGTSNDRRHRFLFGPERIMERVACVNQYAFRRRGTIPCPSGILSRRERSRFRRGWRGSRREPLPNRPRLAVRGHVILCRRARRILARDHEEPIREPGTPPPRPLSRKGRGEYSDRL